MKRDVSVRKANRPVRRLAFLLMIPLALMATTTTGERIGTGIDGEPASQEKQEKKFSRTYRTTFMDEKDGKEKKVELRYQGEELTEVYIDGEMIEKKNFRNYNDVIRKSEAEAEKIRRELRVVEEDLKRAMNDMEVDIRKAMEEIDKIDFTAINEELTRNMELLTDLRKDQISDAVERARIEMAKARVDSRLEMERVRKEALKEIERAREEIVRTRTEIETMRERGCFNIMINDRVILLPEGPEPVVSAKKREEMHRKLEELEKNGILA